MLLFLALIFAQVVLPLTLIALHAFHRPATRTGLLLRSVALIGLCVLLIPVGFWAFPTWWTPHVFVALAVLASFNAARRLRNRTHAAGAWRRNGEVAVALLLGLVVALQAPAVIGGRQIPAEAVDIAFPLEPGRYLVVNGGHHALLNAHFMTLDNPDLADYRGQSHAVDIIGVDRWGMRATTLFGTEDPADYHIFGARVLAPCDGTVLNAESERPDLPVPEFDTEDRGGNFLLIDCGGFIVYLAHLRQGSLLVGEGDSVAAGSPVAEVGNSGHSGEPHLHVHAQRGTSPDALLAGEPLPVTFDGLFPLRNAVLAGD